MDRIEQENLSPYIGNLSESMNSETEKAATLTQEYLKECLSYDPETGIFVWKDRPQSHFPTHKGFAGYRARNLGKVAGAKNSKGYITIRFGGELHKAHRLAFLYITGCLPSLPVDHVNHIASDNRWANLRIVSQQENARNLPLKSNNRSGVTGVFWVAAHNRWRAEISVKSENIYLGHFKDMESAIAVRKDAENRYGFHINHGRHI